MKCREQNLHFKYIVTYNLKLYTHRPSITSKLRFAFRQRWELQYSNFEKTDIYANHAITNRHLNTLSKAFWMMFPFIAIIP